MRSKIVRHRKDDPLVSVIVPCRNVSDTLPATVSSILSQDYNNIQLILVDDASTDRTSELIKETAGRSDKITAIFSPKNCGAGGARNKGLKKAKGEYIAFVDADVCLDRKWLRSLVARLKTYPDISGAGGAVINGTHTVTGWVEYFLSFSEFTPSTAEGIARTIPTLGVVYRRKDISEMYFEETNYGEDAIFNFRLYQRGGRLFFDPSVRATHFSPKHGMRGFFRKQLLLGNGFHYSRKRFPFPDRWILSVPWLFLLLPRLWLISGRMIITKYLVLYAAVFPLVLAGETVRAAKFFGLVWADLTTQSRKGKRK